MESLNRITDKDHTHSRVEELEACGMSRSILDQVKQGNVYDPFQIEVRGLIYFGVMQRLHTTNIV
jgi:hypothetical protein